VCGRKHLSIFTRSILRWLKLLHRTGEMLHKFSSAMNEFCDLVSKKQFYKGHNI